jgi:hypothetical protein
VNPIKAAIKYWSKSRPYETMELHRGPGIKHKGPKRKLENAIKLFVLLFLQNELRWASAISSLHHMSHCSKNFDRAELRLLYKNFDRFPSCSMAISDAPHV